MKQGLSILLFVLITLSGCKQAVNFDGATENETSLGQPPGTPLIQGPVVNIVQPPSDHHLDLRTEVFFEVIPGDFAIAKIECFVNGQAIDCDGQSGHVKLSGLPVGDHLFEVVATDIKDLFGKAREKWVVFDRFKRHLDNLKVDNKPAKTDVLFVVDNSTSMWYEQTQISKRFANFIDQIDGMDWQIGITTTDPRSRKEWGDGRLHPFKEGLPFLTTDLGKEKAQKLFAKHVKRRELGWDIEEGIRATYRAIERSLKNRSKEDQDLHRFFRSDASLAVVLVSDEDESRDYKRNDGDHLIDLVKKSWGPGKVFQFNSIITYTQSCLDGAGRTMGLKYEALSKKTSGLVGDICSKNYSELLKQLGQGVAGLQRTYKLKCVPQDIDVDGKVDLEVLAKNPASLPGYTIDKDMVVFDQALQEGEYDFHYFCLD